MSNYLHYDKSAIVANIENFMPGVLDMRRKVATVPWPVFHADTLGSTTYNLDIQQGLDYMCKIE